MEARKRNKLSGQKISYDVITDYGRNISVSQKSFEQLVLLLQDKDVQFIEFEGIIVNKSAIREVARVIYK